MRWNIDPTHALVEFSVQHMAISTVKGHYKSCTASGETNDAGVPTSLSMEIDAASIFTNNEQRDGHLKSADFFDAATYPELRFVSTAFKRVDEEKFHLEGTLSIRGTERPVVLEGEYNGIMDDFYGNTKAGFDLRGKINRHDFGLAWSAVTEAGGVVVSDEVRLELNVQMTQDK